MKSRPYLVARSRQHVRADRVDEGDAEGLDAGGAGRRSRGDTSSTTPSWRRHAGAPRAAACGAVVASALSCQRALKPVSPTCRSSGRKRPANDGCGQSDGERDLGRCRRPARTRARRCRPARRRSRRASGRCAPANDSATSAWKPRGCAACCVPGRTGTTAPSICTAALRTPRESPRATNSTGASQCSREPGAAPAGTQRRAVGPGGDAGAPSARSR